MSSRDSEPPPTGTARPVLALVAALVLTVATVLLVAGHGPWAGPRLIPLSADHGLNLGDVPVLLAWVLCLSGCARLGLHRSAG